MMTLTLDGHLQLTGRGGAQLGDQRVRLLEAIDRHGSISQAARHVPLSYKAAWEAVEAINNLADRPLVERCTGGRDGGGTRLTDQGRRIVALYRALEAENRRTLARLADHVDSLAMGDAGQVLRQLRRLALRSSARNQFAGRVCGLIDGPVDFEVHVAVDPGLQVIAQITQASARQLGLAIGTEVVALVKAPALQLLAAHAPDAPRRNALWGTVARIVDGPRNAEVTLDLAGGRNAVAVLPREQLAALGLQPGDPAGAAFDASAVILHVID
jgi:molybdate transport system regulatory protein